MISTSWPAVNPAVLATGMAGWPALALADSPVLTVFGSPPVKLPSRAVP